MKKFLAIFMVFALMFMSSITCFASESSAVDSTDENFTEISREDYIKHLMESQNMTYDEAEQHIDSAINATISKHMTNTVSPCSIDFDKTIDEYENGVQTLYGYVTSTLPIPHTDGILKVTARVYTVIVVASVGRYISSVDGNVSVYPATSGIYTVSGSGNVDWDEFHVNLSYTGVGEIAKSSAIDLGMSLGAINFGASESTTEYLRYPFALGETYTVSNK